MRKSFFAKGISLTIFFLMLFCALTFAADKNADKNIVRVQGRIMELDLKKGTMVISERMFVWDQKTTFHNEKGAPVTIEKLRIKAWVYIEGENDEVHKRWVAKKVYLLPKYIGRKERHLYSFIPED